VLTTRSHDRLMNFWCDMMVVSAAIVGEVTRQEERSSITIFAIATAWIDEVSIIAVRMERNKR